MKLLIPPPIQFLVCGGGAWLLARALPALDFSASVLLGAGWSLIAAGAAILVVSVLMFFKAKTTVNPHAPDRTKTLVRHGLYRFSRNPMYLAMALLLIGGAALLQNGAAFAGPVMFVLAVTYLQIMPEEKALREKFGDDYADYCRRTRRWI
ncbi:MAG: isoprenylcysteine carboxylmethyltransferase family protein [Pseudomonadota bacterium]